MDGLNAWTPAPDSTIYQERAKLVAQFGYVKINVPTEQKV